MFLFQRKTTATVTTAMTKKRPYDTIFLTALFAFLISVPLNCALATDPTSASDRGVGASESVQEHTRGITPSGNAGFFVSGVKKIPSGSWTNVDYLGMYDEGNNDLGDNVNLGTGYFVAPVTGYYAFSVSAAFPPNSRGTTRVAAISIDGDFLKKALAITSVVPGVAAAALGASNSHVRLTAGESVNAAIFQDSGTKAGVLVMFSGHLVSQG